MPELDVDALLTLLDEKELRPCPACGNDEWHTGVNPVFIPNIDSDSVTTPGHGFRAVALICSNCGLLHLHNVGVLTGALDIADDADGENTETDDSD